MFGITAVIAVSAVIVAYEWPGLRKQGSARAIVAFFTMLFIGLGIMICIFAGIEVPGPAEPLRILFEPMGKAIRGE
ncbi:hypothetical protein EV294_102323 [Paenibacillus sp. BK033]|nr:hypothetical protein EV294_102323 [Paenibacillus sp. BK033]